MNQALPITRLPAAIQAAVAARKALRRGACLSLFPNLRRSEVRTLAVLTGRPLRGRAPDFGAGAGRLRVGNSDGDTACRRLRGVHLDCATGRGSPGCLKNDLKRALWRLRAAGLDGLLARRRLPGLKKVLNSAGRSFQGVRSDGNLATASRRCRNNDLNRPSRSLRTAGLDCDAPSRSALTATHEAGFQSPAPGRDALRRVPFSQAEWPDAAQRVPTLNTHAQLG